MSDSASWFARKLGGAQPAPQAYVPPPQQYVPPPQPPAYPQQPVYPQQFQPQQYQQPQPQQVDGETLLRAAREGFIDIGTAVREGAKLWKGGKGVKTETTNCPECDSPHFFSRKGRGVRGMPPAPICMACGYNGLYEQYGAVTPVPDGLS